MLQQPALEAWKHPLAKEYVKKIDFTGIFVPTDIAWGEQISSLGDRSLDIKSHKLLSMATFTTHVLKATVAAIQGRISSRTRTKIEPLKIGPDQEADVVTRIAPAWYISNIVPSLSALDFALSSRLSQLFVIASREAIDNPERRDERLAAIPFLHLHFLKAAKLLLEAIDEAAGINSGKWALLVDELELAPEWIQEELARLLRSTDDRFLFKLALSPFSENAYLMKDAQSAAAGQDFDPIPLWYPNKIDSFKFCSELWFQMLEDRQYDLSTKDKISRYSPQKVLGESYFDPTPEGHKSAGSAYQLQSRLISRFMELAEKDASFVAYLSRNKITDLKEITRLKENRRAAVVRKAAPLVAVREFYRRPDVQGLSTGALRSRKTAILYSGMDSLFAITEGNPRWFIAIVDRLLDRWQAQDKKIDYKIQAEEVFNAGQRFQAMLKAIPVAAPGTQEVVGVLDLIETVAEYFHHHIVREPFTADPPESFEVDHGVGTSTLTSLATAINTGAVIWASKDQQAILTSLEMLRGQRFRLSYLLAPIYGLPLRLGQERALSTIIRRQLKKKRGEGVQLSKQQLSLLEAYKNEQMH
jgi:hypothetical protein